MKNKIIGMVTISTCALCLYGCGNTSLSNNNSSVSAKYESSSMLEVTSVNEDAGSDYSSIPVGNFSDIGNGEIILHTSGGSSENGNIPVIYTDSGDLLIELGLESRDFDGSKLSFIYIDGNLVDKEQLSNLSEVNVDLQDFMLNPGKHKVEVMQFDNDDTSTQPITYKTESYEIKNK